MGFLLNFIDLISFLFFPGSQQHQLPYPEALSHNTHTQQSKNNYTSSTISKVITENNLRLFTALFFFPLLSLYAAWVSSQLTVI